MFTVHRNELSLLAYTAKSRVSLITGSHKYDCASKGKVNRHIPNTAVFSLIKWIRISGKPIQIGTM